MVHYTRIQRDDNGPTAKEAKRQSIPLVWATNLKEGIAQ